MSHPIRRRGRAGRATKLLVAVAALASGLSAAVPSQRAGAEWAAPGFVRSFGGPAVANVYPWGMEYNAHSNEIVVSDYWNYKVRRYDPAGRELGAFYRPKAKGQPYSVSVDPTDGTIYVPEMQDFGDFGYFAQYDRNGVFMREVYVDAGYIAWTHIDDDGFLWVADSHYWNHENYPPEIRKFDLHAGSCDCLVQQVEHWGTFGAGPGELGIVHGLATYGTRQASPGAEPGRIYVADGKNRVVHVFLAEDGLLPTDQAGKWLFDFGSGGTGPGHFVGDLRGLAIDALRGRVYVVDAEGGKVEVFDLSGSWLGTFGSPGSGDGQFADGGREVTVDADGDVWVADFGNYRMIEFRPEILPEGTLTASVLSAHPSPPGPPAAGGFSQVRDVAVDAAGNVWSPDTWNNRFQKFGSDGAFLATWGYRNSDPPYGLNYPRGIAVEPLSGDIWVANTRDHHIRVYDAAGNYLRMIGTGVDSSRKNNLRAPMDMEFHDGKAYIADYASSRVKTFSVATGKELSSLTLANNGVAIDPGTGNLYVVSYATDRVHRYAADGVTLLGTFGSSGTGPGQFRTPWDVDVVGSTVYVTDSELARVQAFSLDGAYLGQWGTKGTGAIQFNLPSGITHDAVGNIYVADAGNSRIQVFSPSVPPPTGDLVRPTVTMTSPSANDVVPALPAVVVSGTAGDNVRLAAVQVAIRDTATGLWWDARGAIWKGGTTWNAAPQVSADGLSSTWAFTFSGRAYGKQYRAQARALDTTGNASTLVSRLFSVAA